MEDSDFTPGAYFFDVMPLPRNDHEANLLVRKFQEDASRWAQYEYEEFDDDEEGHPMAVGPQGYNAQGFSNSLFFELQKGSDE